MLGHLHDRVQSMHDAARHDAFWPVDDDDREQCACRALPEDQCCAVCSAAQALKLNRWRIDDHMRLIRSPGAGAVRAVVNMAEAA